MNDYNELIERCKEICDWQDTGLLKGDALRNFAASRPYAQQHNSVSIAQAETLREVADAFLVMAARVAELEAARIAYASEFPPDAEGLPDTGRIHANICAMKVRVAELKSRLEISPLHNVDGIMARDATIKLQDGRIAELEADRNTWRDKYMTQAGQLDLLKEAATFLASERAEREKQEPVAWLDRSTEERPGDTVWLPDDLQGMSTRGLVPLYAAPPVITQHEPVTTVEDRYNADGKSCHITDDLPAGMPLYAAQPVAAPVRLTDEQAEKVDEAIREALGDAYDCLRVWNAWSYGTMGPDDFSQVAEDPDRVAEIRNAAAVALGFKLEGEQ